MASTSQIPGYSSLPLPTEINLAIYAYLPKNSLLACRSVSSQMKAEIESIKEYKEIQIHELALTTLGGLERKKSISDGRTKIAGMRSYGKEIRVLAQDGKLWKIVPGTVGFKPATLNTYQSEIKTTCFNERFIAYAETGNTPFHTTYTTRVFEIDSGKPIDTIHLDPYLLLGWCDESNLLMHFNGTEGSGLYLRNVYRQFWQRLFETKHKILDAKVSETCMLFTSFKDIGLVASDLNGKHPHILKRSSNIHQIGITSANNIYYAEDRNFTLMDPQNIKTLIEIKLPLTPKSISFSSPLLACAADTQFVVYDLRKPNVSLIDYDFKNDEPFSLSRYLLPDSTRYADAQIAEIALHNLDLAVAKENGTFELYDLAKPQSVFRRLFNFFG